jgi:hypothetical protein
MEVTAKYTDPMRWISNLQLVRLLDFAKAGLGLGSSLRGCGRRIRAGDGERKRSGDGRGVLGFSIELVAITLIFSVGKVWTAHRFIQAGQQLLSIDNSIIAI